MFFYFQFQCDGFVVIEDFLNEKEVEELRTAGTKLAYEIPKESRKCVFSTTQVQQVRKHYFIIMRSRQSNTGSHLVKAQHAEYSVVEEFSGLAYL